MESLHKSVLLKESIEGLNLKEGYVIVDGTFGGGGHSREILSLYKNIKIIAIDLDNDSWKRFSSNHSSFKNQISFHNTNFSNIDKVLKKENLQEIDGLLLDLGISSDQIEVSGSGFSFMRDELLSMNMKSTKDKDDISAYEIINNWQEDSISSILYGYGDEKFSRQIAKGIVKAREKEKIKTTLQLVKIIENSVPSRYRHSKIHCATKTFQALRIAVNDELRNLEKVLELGFNFLKKKRRMVIISFHSLEDRIVKNFYKNKFKEGIAILINKKVIRSKDEELKINKRARSAKLRILEKI